MAAARQPKNPYRPHVIGHGSKPRAAGMSPRARRLAWFVALWAAGVAATGVLALLLRGLLGGVG